MSRWVRYWLVFRTVCEDGYILGKWGCSRNLSGSNLDPAHAVRSFWLDLRILFLSLLCPTHTNGGIILLEWCPIWKIIEVYWQLPFPGCFWIDSRQSGSSCIPYGQRSCRRSRRLDCWLRGWENPSSSPNLDPLHRIFWWTILCLFCRCGCRRDWLFSF